MAQEVAIATISPLKQILGPIIGLFLLLFPIILGIIFLKRKRYTIFWGGIIGLIFAVLSIPLGLFDIFGHECEFLTQCSGEGCMSCIYGGMFLAYFQLTLFGFLIGWIIGKIKSRKESASSS